MKSKLSRFLLIFLISLGSLVLVTPADAYVVYVQQSGYYYHHHRHHHHHGRYVCTVRSGYWRHGFWHPAQQVCFWR